LWGGQSWLQPPFQAAFSRHMRIFKPGLATAAICAEWSTASKVSDIDIHAAALPGNIKPSLIKVDFNFTGDAVRHYPPFASSAPTGAAPLSHFGG
jgi:hypothetical protein